MYSSPVSSLISYLYLHFPRLRFTESWRIVYSILLEPQGPLKSSVCKPLLHHSHLSFSLSFQQNSGDWHTRRALTGVDRIRILAWTPQMRYLRDERTADSFKNEELLSWSVSKVIPLSQLHCIQHLLRASPLAEAVKAEKVLVPPP